jgi:hypothetical protein
VGSYLVYTILLAVQLVGFESIDRYSLDVFQNSGILLSLEVQTDESVVRFIEGEDVRLEVERSRLYGHMYTTYTSAAESPRAFSLLDAILQIPPRPRGSFTITLRGESVPPELLSGDVSSEELRSEEDAGNGSPAVAPASGQTSAATPRSMEGTPAEAIGAETEVPLEASWEIVMRDAAIYLTASMRDLVLVLR